MESFSRMLTQPLRLNPTAVAAAAAAAAAAVTMPILFLHTMHCTS